MTGRLYARLARLRASEARASGNARGIDPDRMDKLREYLRGADNGALAAWLEQRRSQELESFAAECDQAEDAEITVVTGPRRN